MFAEQSTKCQFQHLWRSLAIGGAARGASSITTCSLTAAEQQPQPPAPNGHRPVPLLKGDIST